jgi:hypothetical protein
MNPRTIDRRQFIWLASCAVGGGLGLPTVFAASAEEDSWDPHLPFQNNGKRLKVQPILMYTLPTPKEAASWKSWGGVQTQQGVAEEATRIDAELKRLEKQAGFGLEILPLLKITNVDAARAMKDHDWDVTLLYACTGGGALLQACLGLKPDSLVFVRHRSGPVYYWYEALSTRFLQTDSPGQTPASAARPQGPHVEDVVVDDYAELAGKLRALQAVKSFLGTRIVALGGPWGKYAADAPQQSQERFGLKILEVSYDDFGPRVQRALGDPKLMDTAEAWTRRYLAMPRTGIKTDRQFVVNAFVLYRLFKDLMREQDATAFTIKSCMGTILPMAHTTACLTLSLLNDEGLIAFCESDFVIIPAGLLLRHLARRPVFLHNSTFPHHGVVTCAHCTSPRRLDGRHYEPTQILTHYESEFGAAPKVAMPLGQEVTIVDPEYSTARWLGFRGKVEDNPFYDICRSQQDIRVHGAWKKLKSEARDSHWVMAYGDWLNELGYAARKVGVQWSSLDETS